MSDLELFIMLQKDYTEGGYGFEVVIGRKNPLSMCVVSCKMQAVFLSSC